MPIEYLFNFNFKKGRLSKLQKPAETIPTIDFIVTFELHLGQINAVHVADDISFDIVNKNFGFHGINVHFVRVFRQNCKFGALFIAPLNLQNITVSLYDVDRFVKLPNIPKRDFFLKKQSENFVGASAYDSQDPPTSK
jgi:hypothetical protein